VTRFPANRCVFINCRNSSRVRSHVGGEIGSSINLGGPATVMVELREFLVLRTYRRCTSATDGNSQQALTADLKILLAVPTGMVNVSSFVKNLSAVFGDILRHVREMGVNGQQAERTTGVHLMTSAAYCARRRHKENS